MKTTIITLLMLAAGTTISLAQCDKKVSLTSSKTQHYDAQGALKHADDEKVSIDFTQSDMTITIVNDNDTKKLTGKVKTDACDWKVPFREGSTKLDVTMTNDQGESRDFTITITGKDGKVTFTAESKEEPDDVIKLDVDKFEEKS